MSSASPVWPRDTASTAGLLPWMSPIPSYLPTVALQTVVDDLGQFCLGSAPLPWPSHIILTDDQHRPQGCLAVGLLWACQQGQGGEAPAVYLQDCLPWMEPVVTLMAHTTPAELSRLMAQSSSPCWVVVDAEGQYLGVVNGADLIAQGPLTPAVSGLTTTSAQEQQWVMTISHAFKTPLTSLLGLSTLLLDHRVGPLNERQSRYAGLMRRAIRKLIRLVNQLVDWMRLEAGQLDLETVPVDLKALTETLLPTFLSSWLPDAASPPPWMATFRCHLPSQVPDLWADRLRLQQSLYGVLGYLLHRGAIPQTLSLEPWGTWVGLTLRAATETDDASPLPWTVAHGAEIDGLETLGLALARRLCQQQGGDLVGFCSPWDGYQITILLPGGGVSEADRAREMGLPNSGDLAATIDAADRKSPYPIESQTLGSETLDPETLDSEILDAKTLGYEPLGSKTLVLLVSTDGEWLVRTQEQIAPGAMRLILATHWEDALDMAQRLSPTLVLLQVASLENLPSDPCAALAQVAPQSRALVVDSLEALALALAPPKAALPSPDRRPTQPSEAGPENLPKARVAPSAPLTLLVLTYPGQAASATPPTVPHLTLPDAWQTSLQRQHCRLVQADNLAQARLLCRVWQPQAIVLMGGQGFTRADWNWVSQCPELLRRPWISLSAVAGPVSPELTLMDGSGALAQPVAEGVASLLQLIRSSADPAAPEG